MDAGALWRVSCQLLFPKKKFSSSALICSALPSPKSFPFYRRYLEAKKASASQGSESLRVAVRYAYAV